MVGSGICSWHAPAYSFGSNLTRYARSTVDGCRVFRTWDVENSAKTGINYLSTSAGFQTPRTGTTVYSDHKCPQCISSPEFFFQISETLGISRWSCVMQPSQGQDQSAHDISNCTFGEAVWCLCPFGFAVRCRISLELCYAAILYKQQSISMQNLWQAWCSCILPVSSLEWAPWIRRGVELQLVPFRGHVNFRRGNSSLYITMVLAVSRNHVLLQAFARVVRGASCAFRLSEGKPLT